MTIGKKKSGSGSKSPTVLTLETLREAGWKAQKVEYFNTFARRRIDLFGCIDIVAMAKGFKGLLGVQACITDDIHKRAIKAKDFCRDYLILWLNAGNQYEVWGWAKRGERGKAKYFERKRLQFKVIDKVELIYRPLTELEVLAGPE